MRCTVLNRHFLSDVRNGGGSSDTSMLFLRFLINLYGYRFDNNEKKSNHSTLLVNSNHTHHRALTHHIVTNHFGTDA
jgi:hypothetical protein